MTTVPPQFTCGVNTHITYLIQGLQEWGIEHDLLTYSSQAQYSRMAFAKNLLRKLKYDPMDRWLRHKKIFHFRRLLREQLAKRSYQLIHSHDGYATLAVLDEIGKKIPIITTMHGPLAYEMVSMGENENSQFVLETFSMEKRAFSNSDLCIAVDTRLMNVLHQDMNTKPENIRMIPNALKIEHIQKVAQGMNVFNIPSPFYLIPRRIVPNSGIQYAIEALQYCHQSISLAIAGDGSFRAHLDHLVDQLKFDKRIKFLGDVRQEKLLPLMMASSGVLVPSIPSHGVIEATSLAVLEAMACKKPIIASDIGGISEILRPIDYPFLTKPGDAEQIGRYMDAILAMDKDPLNQILERNYQQVVKRHSLEVWMRATLNAYQAACGIDFLGEKQPA